MDQLEKHVPNQIFIENVTEILQRYNFTVMQNRSAEVTVNFYKNLPKSNPGIIIFRVHSAVRNNTQLVDFFTSEPYIEGKYEEYGERLSIAWYPWELKEYFAVGPGFVEVMDGNFPRSIIIAMGCGSLKYPTMAQAFINKGAKLYVGWTGNVSITDSDKITLELLELLFIKNKTIEYAVGQCNTIFHEYEGKLDYFPKEVGNKEVWEVILSSKSVKIHNVPSYFRNLRLIFINKEDTPTKRLHSFFHNV
ncbi:MAG: hypothetical protein QXQ94_08695 [Candidatus Bathyarchaeia archaeon]